MKYKLVIFDWDGTVMDSVPKIVNTLQLAAAQVGVEVPCETRAASIIGLSLDTAVATLFPNDAPLWHELAAAYQHQYKYGDDIPTPLFEGAQELLENLKHRGAYLAVATGKGRSGLNAMLSKTGVGHYFSTTRTADEASSKPHPDMIQQILQELNVVAEDAVMIGDSLLDMQMAQSAGVDAIAMSCGAASEAQLLQSNALAVCANFQQLAQSLRVQHVEPAFCE
jgi:phosphoglycolate phosphatase